MEDLLVPNEDRTHPQYAGYYFVFSVSDIGDALKHAKFARPS